MSTPYGSRSVKTLQWLERTDRLAGEFYFEETVARLLKTQFG